MEQTNNTKNQILEQALYYREKLGWSVIPIGDNKKPLIKWEIFQKEKATKEQIIEWFTKWPNANLAIVTGKISNLIVVDIDPRHGGTRDDFKDVQTLIVETGGGGWHYYFQYEEGITNHAGIKPGIDIRGDGGYVIVPPSVHPSGNKYEWEVAPND
jgi:hypothetical protein